MSGPITWRNVNGRSDSAAAALLGQASDSINNAFSSFDTALDTAIAGRKAEYDHTVKTNTDAFLNEMAKYRSPEALEAARPDLESMLTGFNGDVNTSQTRGAIDRSIADLRASVNATDKYNQNQRIKNARPQLEEIDSMIAQGQFGAATQLLDTLDLPGEAERYGKIKSGKASAEDRSYTLEQRARNQQIQAQEDLTRQTNKQVDQEAKQGETWLDNLLQNQTERLNNVMLDSGFNPTASPSSLSQGDARYLAAMLQDNNVTNLSATEVLSRYGAYVKDKLPDATASQIQGLKDALGATITSRNTLHPVDQATLDKDLDNLAKAYQIENNPLINQTAFNPYTELGNITTEFKDKFADIGDGDSKEVTDLMLKAMTEGIDLGDGKSKQVIPPDLLRAAMVQVEDDWIDDTFTEEDLRDLVVGGGFNKYKKQADEYNTRKLQTEASALTKYGVNNKRRDYNELLRGIQAQAKKPSN